MGFRRIMTPQSAGRVGVARIGDFYARFTGCRGIPESEAAWLRYPSTRSPPRRAAKSSTTLSASSRACARRCCPATQKTCGSRSSHLASSRWRRRDSTTTRGRSNAATPSRFARARGIHEGRDFRAPSAEPPLRAILQVALAQRGGAAEAFRSGARDGGALRTERGARKSDRIDMRARACGARGAGLSSSDDPFLVAQAVETTRRIKSEYLRKLSVTRDDDGRTDKRDNSARMGLLPTRFRTRADARPARTISKRFRRCAQASTRQ